MNLISQQKNIKKVLIVTYYFPPANFAGSYRIVAMAKILHSFGYYPVVVTRCWNPNQSEHTDEVINNTFSHEKYEHYEVYNIPYKRNLRDRIHAKKTTFNRKWLSKILTVNVSIFQNYFNSLIPYSNLYTFADQLLSKDKSFSALIVSAGPFQLFKLASQLHKKHGISWVADYRDDWSTSQWISSLSFVEKIIRRIESSNEKRWLHTAAAFTSCSESLVEKIGVYIGKQGVNVLNGYNPEEYEVSIAKTKENSTFTIVYNGTLYATQPVELFIDACKEIIDIFKSTTIIHIKFPGLLIDQNQANRVKKLIVGYEKHFEILKRVSKEEVVIIQKSADLLLMIGHQNIIGTYSSKIFEYLACKVPILLYPTDHDVLESLIMKTNSGQVCSSKKQAVNTLQNMINEKLKFGTIKYKPITKEVEKYSRKNQVKKLASLLDQIC